MNPTIPDAVESKASIAKHPIHPMLVPLPIGFLVGALLSDLGYYWTESAFWAEASQWLLLAGFVTGLLAALFGLVDFFGIAYVRSHTAAWVHFLGNALVLVLSFFNFMNRSSDNADTVSMLGLSLSFIQVLILLVTGWLGGELSYRYRVGIMERDENRSELPH
jgi:uncharacterized membrane protein